MDIDVTCAAFDQKPARCGGRSILHAFPALTAWGEPDEAPKR
ncbi:hypothetical protein [Streptomyces sp. T028]